MTNAAGADVTTTNKIILNRECQETDRYFGFAGCLHLLIVLPIPALHDVGEEYGIIP